MDTFPTKGGGSFAYHCPTKQCDSGLDTEWGSGDEPNHTRNCSGNCHGVPVCCRSTKHNPGPGGGRPLGSGRQLPPQLSAGRRPLGGGGGGHWKGGVRARVRVRGSGRVRGRVRSRLRVGGGR